MIWTRKIALVFGMYNSVRFYHDRIFHAGGLKYISAERYGKNLANPLAGYSILQFVIGISGFAVTLLIPSLAGIALNAAGVSFGSIVIKTLAAFTILLLPCTAMGATLPLLTAFFPREHPDILRESWAPFTG